MESIVIDELFSFSSMKRTLPHTDKYSILKRYNDFKCALRWKFFDQSTQKFRKVANARYEFRIKHCLNIADQSIHPWIDHRQRYFLAWLRRDGLSKKNNKRCVIKATAKVILHGGCGY